MPWEFSAEVQQRIGFDRLPAVSADVTTSSVATPVRRLASLRAERVNLTGGGDPERVGAVRVSRNFLTTLGVQPVHGRVTLPMATVPRPVMYPDRPCLCQRRYAARLEVLVRRDFSQRRTRDDRRVMPPWFHFPAAGELPAGFGYAPLPEVWSLVS